jgi:hypothetical protein
MSHEAFGRNSLFYILSYDFNRCSLQQNLFKSASAVNEQSFTIDANKRARIQIKFTM